MSELKSDNLKIAILFKKEGLNPADLKFGEAKLKSGELIMYDGDTPVQGAAIGIQTPAGDFAPANGILELEDGTIIEATDGLIANVKPAGTPEEQQPAQPAAPAQPMEQGKENLTPGQEAAVKRTIESVVKETHFNKTEVEEMVKPLTELATKFSEQETAYKAKFEAQEKTINEQNEKLGTLTKQISQLISLLEKKPATAPAVPVNTAFKTADEKADAQLDKIMEVIKNS